MKKKFLLCIFIFLFIFQLQVLATDDEIDYAWIKETVMAATTAEDIEILSRCAVAYDRNSKTIIYGKNEEEKVPMASTTKIMTAIILVENANLDEEVIVCKKAAMVGGSTINLKTGDKITYNDLLYGLMLESGNDAATQIAISLAGSTEEFAELMNDKAKELGLKSTHFVTPHGLDNEEHYTTATELAIIADYALNIPKIAEVVSTKNYIIHINGYPKALSNTNELLGYLEGVNGVKTGFTNGAGRCLVTSAKRGDFEIITAILGADTKKIRTKDSINLIEYVYKNYELINLGEFVQEEFAKWTEANKNRIDIDKARKYEIKLKLGEIKYIYYPIRKDKKDKIFVDTIKNNLMLEAPVDKGYVLANIFLRIEDDKIMNVPIKLDNSITKKNIFDYFIESLSIFETVRF